MNDFSLKDNFIFNLGYLLGQLETIARFNDKTDHGYDFNIILFEKSLGTKRQLERHFESYSDRFEMIEISDPITSLKKLLNDNWFFENISSVIIKMSCQMLAYLSFCRSSLISKTLVGLNDSKRLVMKSSTNSVFHSS